MLPATVLGAQGRAPRERSNGTPARQPGREAKCKVHTSQRCILHGWARSRAAESCEGQSEIACRLVVMIHEYDRIQSQQQTDKAPTGVHDRDGLSNGRFAFGFDFKNGCAVFCAGLRPPAKSINP